MMQNVDLCAFHRDVHAHGQFRGLVIETLFCKSEKRFS